jgi:hypothetical protein
LRACYTSVAIVAGITLDACASIARIAGIALSSGRARITLDACTRVTLDPGITLRSCYTSITIVASIAFGSGYTRVAIVASIPWTPVSPDGPPAPVSP